MMIFTLVHFMSARQLFTPKQSNLMLMNSFWEFLSPRCEDVPILCSVVSSDLASLLVISQSALFSCFQQYLRDLSCEDSSRYKQILNGILPSSQADYLSTPHTFSCSISSLNSPKSFLSTVKKKHVSNETAKGCGCLSVLLVIYLLIAFFGD